MSSTNDDISMFYKELPRDLQLKVSSRFDMDTRINIGMVGKLRVPQELKNAITKSFDMSSDAVKIPISYGRHYILDYNGNFYCLFCK